MLTQYNLKMPHAVYGGENAMDNITAIIKARGAKKVAMFTDKGIEGAGLFALPEEAVKASGAEYYVLDELPPEPSYMAVQKLVDEFKVSGADLIVACGGGSVMDAAKLASVLVTDAYGVKELLDNPGMAQKCVPIVLIPTTAGTGAEVTPNAIVAVPEKELKVGIVNENMIADYVILDARMIKNLPRKIAAAVSVPAPSGSYSSLAARLPRSSSSTVPRRSRATRSRCNGHSTVSNCFSARMARCFATRAAHSASQTCIVAR